MSHIPDGCGCGSSSSKIQVKKKNFDGFTCM